MENETDTRPVWVFIGIVCAALLNQNRFWDTSYYYTTKNPTQTSQTSATMARKRKNDGYMQLLWACGLRFGYTLSPIP